MCTRAVSHTAERRERGESEMEQERELLLQCSASQQVLVLRLLAPCLLGSRDPKSLPAPTALKKLRIVIF